MRKLSHSILLAAAVVASGSGVAAGQDRASPDYPLRQLLREVCPRAYGEAAGVTAEAKPIVAELVERCLEEHRELAASRVASRRRADSLAAVLDSVRRRLATADSVSRRLAAVSRGAFSAGPDGDPLPRVVSRGGPRGSSSAGAQTVGARRAVPRAANSREARLLAQALSAPLGQMLVNTDTVMRVGVPSQLVVRIDQRVGEQIKQRLSESGVVHTDTVRITTTMSVDVHGVGFDIARVPSSAKPEQLVLPDNFTEWRFEVTPQSRGADTLYVVAAARFDDGGKEEARYYPMATIPVRVRVNITYTTAQFVKEYWQWLLGTPLLPLFGWFARRKSGGGKHGRGGGSGSERSTPRRAWHRLAARRSLAGSQRQDT